MGKKVLYSDMSQSILELMDCQCVPEPELDKAELLAEYDASIAECAAMLSLFLAMAKCSEDGSACQEMANDEVRFWSRMLKTAKTQRRGLLTA